MSNLSPLSPKIPQKTPGHLDWGSLYDSATGLAIANSAQTHTGITLIITKDTLSANQLEREIKFFYSSKADSPFPILNFPDWETLPYDTFSPHQDIISQRLKTLSQLPTLKHGILILSINTLMHRIAPREYLSQHSLALTIKQNIDLNNFRHELEKSGYHYVSQVVDYGEFSVRGSIIDLYPMGSDYPYRIDIFDDEIDSIRTFNPDSQQSIQKIDQIALLPAQEFPLTDKAIDLFRQKWRENFSGNPLECPIYQDISDALSSAGIEYYIPLFFDHTSSLLDYLPANTLIIRHANIQDKANQFWQDIQTRYESLRHDIRRPILPPNDLFIPEAELFSKLKAFSQIRLQHTDIKFKTGKCAYATQAPPVLDIDHKAKQPLQKLQDFLTHYSGRILFAVETTGRREALLNLLNTISLRPKLVQTWHKFLEISDEICIAVAPLDSGLNCLDPTFVIITESQLFGQRILQRRRRKKIKQDTDAIINNLTELHIGDPVVHIDHGVGRFIGLQTISIGDQTDEYLTLQYADNDKLYVPISSLDLISRYSSGDIEHAPLHKLGGKQWDKIKRKAAEKVHDAAAELLAIYASRAARLGHAFQEPDQQYLAFAANFPFEETPDQETAIQQVLNDMRSEKPMDRLICGDVGFGKTEVAMRAAFLAVQDNKQVAILVPTTLLAQQHYETFKDRFADWPINIALLSRFRSPKEQKQILEQLKNHQADIVIGTHKLLQKDIAFDQLGLLIIDEEHRFGVRQKERLKAYRTEVDILTLTATPIPRTLNMTFSGIRDLSIIATPPERRLSVKTFVQKHNTHTIKEAILREILRGGQVYFLHNNVKTIAAIARDLEQLVPEARIGIAHGQMPERDLERIMADFYHRRFNVLVCTTIIESGIDIPSANTIIINRADKFGLAQLHQLRGRVGRSHHQAYAYLFIPEEGAITKDAEKRLDAVASLEDLGIGFTLATHDMEIRGTGELLGEEQSGHIQEIGFTLYMEMLERAVKSLKKGKQIDFGNPIERGVEVDLSIPALIPEDYLPDVHMRLILYKRIAGAKNHTELDDLRVEMIDRFGLLPPPTKNLFQIADLKLKAAPLGIKKIEAGAKYGYIEFGERPNVNPTTIIKLIQTEPDKYKLEGTTRLRFPMNVENDNTKIQSAEKTITLIMMMPNQKR